MFFTLGDMDFSSNSSSSTPVKCDSEEKLGLVNTFPGTDWENELSPEDTKWSLPKATSELHDSCTPYGKDPHKVYQSSQVSCDPLESCQRVEMPEKEFQLWKGALESGENRICSVKNSFSSNFVNAQCTGHQVQTSQSDHYFKEPNVIRGHISFHSDVKMEGFDTTGINNNCEENFIQGSVRKVSSQVKTVKPNKTTSKELEEWELVQTARNYSYETLNNKQQKNISEIFLNNPESSESSLHFPYIFRNSSLRCAEENGSNLGHCNDTNGIENFFIRDRNKKVKSDRHINVAKREKERTMIECTIKDLKKDAGHSKKTAFSFQHKRASHSNVAPYKQNLHCTSSKVPEKANDSDHLPNEISEQGRQLDECEKKASNCGNGSLDMDRAARTQENKTWCKYAASLNGNGYRATDNIVIYSNGDKRRKKHTKVSEWNNLAEQKSDTERPKAYGTEGKNCPEITVSGHSIPLAEVNCEYQCTENFDCHTPLQKLTITDYGEGNPYSRMALQSALPCSSGENIHDTYAERKINENTPKQDSTFDAENINAIKVDISRVYNKNQIAPRSFQGLEESSGNSFDSSSADVEDTINDIKQNYCPKITWSLARKCEEHVSDPPQSFRKTKDILVEHLSNPFLDGPSSVFYSGDNRPLVTKCGKNYSTSSLIPCKDNSEQANAFLEQADDSKFQIPYEFLNKYKVDFHYHNETTTPRKTVPISLHPSKGGDYTDLCRVLAVRGRANPCINESCLDYTESISESCQQGGKRSKGHNKNGRWHQTKALMKTKNFRFLKLLYETGKRFLARVIRNPDITGKESSTSVPSEKPLDILSIENSQNFECEDFIIRRNYFSEERKAMLAAKLHGGVENKYAAYDKTKKVSETCAEEMRQERKWHRWRRDSIAIEKSKMTNQDGKRANVKTALTHRRLLRIIPYHSKHRFGKNIDKNLSYKNPKEAFLQMKKSTEKGVSSRSSIFRKGFNYAINK